jgi:hypothetical protein
MSGQVCTEQPEHRSPGSQVSQLASGVGRVCSQAFSGVSFWSFPLFGHGCLRVSLYVDSTSSKTHAPRSRLIRGPGDVETLVLAGPD